MQLSAVVSKFIASSLTHFRKPTLHSAIWRHHPRPPAHRATPFGASLDRPVSTGASAEDLQPETPLSERSAIHAVPLTSLLTWRDTAAQRAATVGSSWVEIDDGPTQEDLETELRWLLDDAVAYLRRDNGHDNDSDPPAWAATRWRDLEREVKAAMPQQLMGWDVRLRASLQSLNELWDKRVYERVPLQYLTSSAYWENLLLSVGQGVLIPRPETELIIDFVVDAVAKRPHLAKGQWADLGTGSGALAIGVARALPTAPIIWAVDVAPTPLAYASYNAGRAGVEHRVKPVQGSWYEPILAAAGASTQLAGIVSNPPYIASEELPTLQAEVGRHEPWLALDGGEGLAVDSLIPICTGALHTLQPGGFIALETGGGEQAAYTAHVLRHMREEVEQGHEVSAFEEVIVRRDLRGIERFVTATRRERD